MYEKVKEYFWNIIKTLMRMTTRHITWQVQNSLELKITVIFNDNAVNIPFLLIQLIKILTVCINLHSSLHERKNRKYYLYVQHSLLMHSREEGTL